MTIDSVDRAGSERFARESTGNKMSDNDNGTEDPLAGSDAPVTEQEDDNREGEVLEGAGYVEEVSVQPAEGIARSGSFSDLDQGPDPEHPTHVPLFKKHADHLHRLSIAGLSSAMEDLGLLSNRSEKESQDVVVATFATLDTDRKNYLSADEFATLYEKATMPTLARVLREEDPALVERLERAFVTWATFGKRDRSDEHGMAREIMMGSPSFIKLLRDANLVKRTEDVHHFDVVFAKVKERGASKISFEQFVDGLRLVAECHHCELDLVAVMARICEATPSMNVTPRESPRRKSDGTNGSPAKRTIHIDVLATSIDDDLRAAFEKYARFGRSREKDDIAGDASNLRLSGQQFSKLARESGLVSRMVSIQKLDIVFASCKSKMTPRTLGISFEEFVVALQLVAKQEGVMADYIINKVKRRTATGPMINSPAGPGGFVRLHDDERAHCGVYGRRLSGVH